MTWFTLNVFAVNFSFLFLGFIFFFTLASYSIHWFLTVEKTEITAQRTVWLSKNKKNHFIFFVLSATGSFIFLIFELQNFKWMLPAIFLTLLYSAPKIPLSSFGNLKSQIRGKTIVLAFAWTYVTVALPLLIQHTQ
jgi:hypothetical protein